MPKSASVAVIGGGVIGASLAYNLAAKGVDRVLVLEKSTLGSGTTTASLGGFRSQFSSELSITLSQMSIRAIENFERLTGYDPLLKYDGYVFMASGEASFQRLKSDQQLQRKLGVPVDLLSGAELQAMFPFYRFGGIIGGTLCMKDGHASTMAVLQGFVTAAKRLGAEFRENTEVTRIEPKATGGFALGTSHGTVDAEAVVIAAGAYSGRVGRAASLQIPIDPFPRKVLVTSSFSEGIPEHIPLLIDVDTTFAFGREGRGLIMATNPPVTPSFDLAFPPTYEEDVMRIAIEKVPAARNASVSRAVAGLYEMSPDANPIVCEIPGSKGIFCCAGFAGHGFMHAPAIGEIFAELFTSGRTSLDISSFDIGRFESGKTDKERRIV